MRFADLTWPEVAALPPDTVAVLPLGSIEQHGPLLPVSTANPTARRSICARSRPPRSTS